MNDAIVDDTWDIGTNRQFFEECVGGIMCEKTLKNNVKLSCCGHFGFVRTDSGAGEIHRVTICSLVQNEIMELCIEIFLHKK